MSGSRHSTHINISQSVIRKKIGLYLSALNRSPASIDGFKKGYCNGLTTLALYGQYLETCQSGKKAVPMDNWSWFKNTLRLLAGWDENIQSLTAQNHADIEHLIGVIEYFQNISDYLPRWHSNLHYSLEDTQHRRMRLEYSFAGLLTVQNFIQPIPLANQTGTKIQPTTLFEQLLRYQHRLILISCGRHTLGLFRNYERVYLYDSNHRRGGEKFPYAAPEKIMKAVFTAYHYINTEPSPIGFRIFTFDKDPQPYPEPKQLLKSLNTPLSLPYSPLQPYTALHIAVRVSSAGCVTYFLNQGADVHALANGGKTPLHVAATKGHLAVVELLLRNRADPNKKCTSGSTPLRRAAESGHLHLLKAMLEKGGPIAPENLASMLACLKPVQQDELATMLTPKKRLEIFPQEGENASPLSTQEEHDLHRLFRLFSSTNLTIPQKRTDTQPVIANAAKQLRK